ncbi:Map3k delta-1 protein kinase isoform 1 [Hibiscus syriacus]|uniref:Map3k delta-1 protein kinase isoform 1 n=1 Tax=Hibiscus syriacus TaxID=106335 RepID=A0A6A3BG70_HIBSY|nr:Map3k delta-1 protein kinase isoform 1 [Hibiscus syriacus]
MYLGWAYVGNRLLSATVEYEETGVVRWAGIVHLVESIAASFYDNLLFSFSPINSNFILRLLVAILQWDGYSICFLTIIFPPQIWVKTTEVLARDRLLGSFTVKPVLIRLKYTLVTLAVSLLVCVLPLVNFDQGGQEGSYMSKDTRARAIPGVYDDDSARSFEPDAFCGEPDLP